MKRNPSAGGFAQGLERMANGAECKASALLVLGLERRGNGVASAARELSAAAENAAEEAAG